MTRRCSGLGLAFAICLLRPVHAQDVSLQIANLLDAYARGDHERAVREVAAWPHPTEFRKAFPKAARAWVDQKPAEAAERRADAAGLVLETARERYERSWAAWGEWRPVIEWTRDEMRRGAPSDAERLWYRAAVGLLGRTQFTRDLDDMIVRAWRRFPEDPFFWVAKAIVLANNKSPDIDVDLLAARGTGAIINNGGMRQQARVGLTAARRQVNSAIGQLLPAVTAPDWGDFAEVQIAHRYLMLHEYEKALAQVAKVNGTSTGTASGALTRYLALTCAGMAAEGLGRTDEASEAYSEALHAFAGQSAALRLAVISGAGTAGTDLIQASLGREDTDPFRLLPYGMYMFWPQVTAQLHNALQ
jgi:hypothetical protein